MAGKTFHCPNCYASLTPGSNPTLKCEYCNSTIIVPPEFRDSEPGVKAGTGAVDINLSSEQGQLVQEIISLIGNEQKIQAIKLYRDLSGGSLKDAKDAVDALEAGQPITFGTLQSLGSTTTVTTVQPQSSGCGCGWSLLVVLLLFVGIGAAAVYLLPDMREMADEFLVEVGLGDLAGLGEGMGLPVGEAGMATAVASFGSEGTGPGFFSDSRHVAVDGAGIIYVGDFQNGRIQRFDADGNFLSLWTVPNDTPLSGLAADRQGVVYAIHGGVIHRYDGETGAALGEVAYESWGFDDLAVDASGRLLGTGWLSFDDQVVRFDTDGNVDLVISEAISGQTGRNELNPSVAVDGLGNIYVMGSFNNVVAKFNADGRFVNQFGGAGSEPGQFQAMSAIAVDGQGRVYVSDIKGVQVFDENGRYLDTLTTIRPVYGMAFTPQNDLLISNGRQISRYQINR
jgi:hypothetical protein